MVLGESAFRVGAAQTFGMLPALGLMLLGGAVADRNDGRRLLVRVHLLAMLPPLGLAIALLQGHRSYESVLVYAVALSAIAAFGIPARDALLFKPRRKCQEGLPQFKVTPGKSVRANVIALLQFEPRGPVLQRHRMKGVTNRHPFSRIGV